MSDLDLISTVHAIAFYLFWVFLTIGSTSTLARVAYYRKNGYKRPRLLNRDVILITGFALSFGFILFARLAGAPNLRDNLVWAIITDTPAVIAVVAYVRYELFVIERGIHEEMVENKGRVFYQDTETETTPADSGASAENASE